MNTDNKEQPQIEEAGDLDELKVTQEPADPGAKPAVATASETGPEEWEQLKAKAAKADEHWDRLLRVSADFENFKKRAARERLEAVKYANESLLGKLISVLDHFDMALATPASAQPPNLDAFKTGINLIYSQLKTLLKDAGLEEINAQNQPFDPNWHEAVSHQESAEAEDGQVVQQLRMGYKLRDRLLRPASVIVAKKPVA